MSAPVTPDSTPGEVGLTAQVDALATVRRAAIRTEIAQLLARVDRKTTRLDTLKAEIVALRAQVQAKRDSLP